MRAVLASLTLLAAAAGAAGAQVSTRPAPQPAAPATTAPAQSAPPAAQGQGAAAQIPGVQSPTETSVPGPAIIGWIRSGQPRNGQLESGDYRMGDGTLADVWYLDAAAGQHIIVELRSQTFDVYMQLLDPYGAKLAESPARGGREAQITFQVPAAGRYQIVVNSAGSDPHTGSYQLSVK
ncbi:MAG: PPC domain-containing protein [Gemmatimonadales bacterium]